MQLLEAYYRDGYVTDPSVPSRIGPGHKRHVIIFITKLDPYGCFRGPESLLGGSGCAAVGGLL